MHQRKYIIVLTFLVFIFVQCSGGGSRLYSSSSDSDGSTTDTVVGGSIMALTITDSKAVVQFEDITEDDEIILMLFAQTSGSTSSAFQVGESLNSPSLIHEALLTDDHDSEENEDDLTGDFHMLLRSFEDDLDPNARLEEPEWDANANLVKYAYTGSQKTFKVLNSFSSSSNYDTVTATLKYQTTNVQFYVDNRNSEDLSQDEVAEMAENFEDVIPTERRLFGEESDINGDGKFAVLFTQAVNELGASAGGMVTGFFYAADLFDSSQYSISNEMEIFYTFVPDATGEYGSPISRSFAETNIYPGVLSHEYQHMISFNQHYNINQGTIESSWLNEALSHLAEDIYDTNSNDYMLSTSLENPARVRGFLESVSSTCFSCGTSLYQRGGSYLFIRYLYEQAELGNFEDVVDGADLLWRLLDTNLTGIDNVVTAVYGDQATEEQFKTLLGLYGLAIYLSNTGVTSDDRFNFRGINLRVNQDDNRGTVLNGPAVQQLQALPFTDTITGTSISYTQISGSEIINNGGQLEIKVSDSADYGGYIIYK